MLLAPTESGTARVGKHDRKNVLTLTARQTALYEAKMKSDWKGIYGMFSPEIRAKISLNDFVAQPHLGAGVASVQKNGADHGGKGEVASDDPFKKEYIPRYVSFRIESISLSDDKSRAKVSSKTDIQMFALGDGATLELPDEEYWIKVNDNWYLEWDIKYIAQISGAQTKKDEVIPEFTVTVSNRELSLWYLAQAEKIEDLHARYELHERALLLHPYAAVEEINRRGINAGDLPARYIDRAMFGRKLNQSLFTSNLDMGRWYKLAGDNDKAYKAYLEANRKDPVRIDALEGLIQTAYDTGNFSAAVEHYISLLNVSSIFKVQPKETLEGEITGDCPICGKVGFALRMELARNAVYAGRHEIAFPVYMQSLKSRDAWPGLLEKGLSGRKIKLKEALGMELLDELKNLSYGDLSALAGQAGIFLFHPADELLHGSRIQNAIELESSPLKRYATYKGGYNTTTRDALAKIRWNEEYVVCPETVKGGYVAVFEQGGGFKGECFKDDNEMFAGSKALLDKMENMKKGEHAYLSRKAPGKNTLTDYWEKGLRDLGIDETMLPRSPSAHIIIFVKGGKSRVLEGDRMISLRLSGSNLDKWSKEGLPSMKVTGKGSNDTVEFLL